MKRIKERLIRGDGQPVSRGRMKIWMNITEGGRKGGIWIVKVTAWVWVCSW